MKRDRDVIGIFSRLSVTVTDTWSVGSLTISPFLHKLQKGLRRGSLLTVRNWIYLRRNFPTRNKVNLISSESLLETGILQTVFVSPCHPNVVSTDSLTMVDPICSSNGFFKSSFRPFTLKVPSGVSTHHDTWIILSEVFRDVFRDREWRPTVSPRHLRLNFWWTHKYFTELWTGQ